MRNLFPENNFVPPRLGTSLRLAIAEAPGKVESERGEPLCGPSGNWLRGVEIAGGKRVGGLYRQAGVKQDEITYCNVINCRPPDNAFPDSQEARSYIDKAGAQTAIQHCIKAHVQPLLESRPWKRLDIFGEKALRYIAGKTDGITTWRGSIIPVRMLGHDIPCAVPTLHPAYIARTQELIPAVISDLRKGTNIPPEFYITKPTVAEFEEFANGAKSVSIDIETNRETDKIICVGLCKEPYKAIVVPFHGEYVVILKRLMAQLEEFIGQNCLQFDLPHLAAEGCTIPDTCQVWDVMLMQHLLQPDMPHKLAFIGSVFTNKPAWKHKADEDLELYCARDVDATYQAFLQLLPILKYQNLLDLYKYVQVPLSLIAYEMEQGGIKVNGKRLIDARERLLGLLAKEIEFLPDRLKPRKVTVNKRRPAHKGEVSPKTGKPVRFILEPHEEEELPYNSSSQVSVWLYGKLLTGSLELDPVLGVDSEEPTVDKRALEMLERRLRREGNLQGARQIAALRNIRKYSKLLGTYMKEAVAEEGIQHPHFNVHGTSSGRFSSSNPNLQNIPGVARIMYEPSHPGWVFVEADYAQIENRLTAYFAKDRARLARFDQPGFSEHKYAASLFFHIPYEEVEKDNDKDAPYGKSKRIVHGVNYAMGKRKIALMYDLVEKEVGELLTVWKRAIQPTIQWQQVVAANAKANGFLATPFHRKRWFYTQTLYTESISFLPQSTAADVIFRAMIALYYDRIGWPVENVLKVARKLYPLPRPARLVLQVHDSLLIESPPELVDEVVHALRVVMEQPWPELGNMILPIEIKTGSDWGSMEVIK
jgi:uracil-DNA glycosylase family 4